jgi:serine/threonine protein kinase
MNERDIFLSALEFDNPNARHDHLKSVCAGDEWLLARVELLFSMHEEEGPFLDIPVVEQLADELSRSIATTILDHDSSKLPPPNIDGYELIRMLGRGGMGVVYEALDLRLNRRVAIKMIRKGDPSETGSLARFRTEARAAARLQHPNIVQVFEVGEQDGHPFLVLELINGCSLGRLTSGVPQPAKKAAELLEILARAVQYAHDHSIIHRDLKPGNILVETTIVSDSELTATRQDTSTSPSKSSHSESSAK